MTLTEQLDRLAAFEPGPYPVVSLYLNTQSGQHGRDQHHAFVRKELKARTQTFPPGSPERESLERDLERIARYLESDVEPSANGVAIFACTPAGLFDAVQTTAPIDQHWLSIGDRPHLDPLARVESQWPRYAAVLTDTNSARILVFAGGELEAERGVQGVKTRRTTEGGWSQKRFQRHIENFHLQHVKEVVDALDRIVRQEEIAQIVLAGDDVVTPLLREQMPKHLAERIVEHVRLDARAPLPDVIRVSLDAMKRANERTDREKVDAAVGEYRAGGLGVVGPDDTLDALAKGQVDELLLSASIGDLRRLPGTPAARAQALTTSVRQESAAAAAGEAAHAGDESLRIADALVTGAQLTGAETTFVEDPELLADWGGVAALLRFRI
jgi:peptide subunit release factor 1 (eRF1)